MSVTAAQRFSAAGVRAGIKADRPDPALVANHGPRRAAAGVLTSNRVKAAPLLRYEQVLASGEVSAVVLNSGGASACTGPGGYQDTRATAARTAAVLDGHRAEATAVASTGLIGLRLPMDQLLTGIETAAAELSPDGGEKAAVAIMTTDSVHKTPLSPGSPGWTVGGMAKGAGMLAPGHATMPVVLTTEADADAGTPDRALRAATRTTFDRIDSDGCMSTDDTVLPLAYEASRAAPEYEEYDGFAEAVRAVCGDLARQLVADAEGASKDIRIDVVGAHSEDDAVLVGRSIARNNLLRCAIHGEDPHWGRAPAAIGTTSAVFDPDRLNVAMNGVWICENGAIGMDRNAVDMTGREVVITADLAAGGESATIWTNDLTGAYVHENSAHSS